MGNFGSCHLCGYEAKSEEEVRMWFQTGCARAIKKEVSYGFTTVMCSETSGGFIPPGAKPDEFEEDPDALKEGIIHMKEANAAALKKAQEVAKKAAEDRARRNQRHDNDNRQSPKKD